jgi:hypothetical protein
MMQESYSMRYGAQYSTSLWFDGQSMQESSNTSMTLIMGKSISSVEQLARQENKFICRVSSWAN